MAWSSLPLIEMDAVNMRRGNSEFKSSNRIRGRGPEDNLEKDISKQLSAFRGQSRTNRDDGGDKPMLDEFGRDIKRKPPSNGGSQGRHEQEGSRNRERSRSPRSWRNEDADRDRSRFNDRGRDDSWKRARDSYYSDGSEDGGRTGERYRDWSSRGRESDRYRERRDYDYRDRDSRDYQNRDDRDYQDRNSRDYQDRDGRDYQDRDSGDYQDRDDRDWRRDRYDDRDDDRRRDYRDKYRNDDDRHWSEHRSHDRYRDDRDYHRRDYREEPSEIVMLKGLASTVEDTQIHEILSIAKLPYKDVRVVKTREGTYELAGNRGIQLQDTNVKDNVKSGVLCQSINEKEIPWVRGYSRGFAFVEFLDMETAKKWIEDCKGKIVIEDVSVIMDFSRSKMAVESHRDWVCSKCGTQNFSSKRRNTCFTCNTPKDENDETKELGSTPCKVLILRGLDVLTTEETVRQSLASFTSTPIFDVRLIKDKLTGTSRGFCFVEFGSIEEATQLKEELTAASFKIDEKALVISYAKFDSNPSKTGTVAVGNSTTSASTSASETPTTSSTASQSRSAFAAMAIAQARAAGQMGHTTDSQTAGSMDHYSTTEATSSVAPSVSTDPVSTASSTTTSETSSTTPADTTAQTPAAISSYVYDAASGYYYDTTTGLYYDPNTQYYYNSTTQQYMYWDSNLQQYVTVISSAANSDTQSAAGAQAQASNEAENVATSKEKQKKAKSLNAKKIAKDMERWAKKQAKNKEAARPLATAQATQDMVKESTYQYDPNDLKGGIKMSVAASSNIANLATASPLAALSELDDPVTTSAPAVGSSLVPEYEGDESGGEDDNKEENYTDWTKLACLLCKRQFPSKEVLTKHNQFSELHKQNLLVQKKLKMSFSEINEYEKQQREQKYRDRAKERRELFGQPDSAPSGRKRKKGKINYEQPTKDGIQSDNIGNKMLQAMGWTAGTGLGKSRQGIVDPILAKMRNRTAGLGLKGSDFGATAGDSERDLLKKMAQSRYDDD